MPHEMKSSRGDRRKRRSTKSDDSDDERPIRRDHSLSRSPEKKVRRREKSQERSRHRSTSPVAHKPRRSKVVSPSPTRKYGKNRESQHRSKKQNRHDETSESPSRNDGGEGSLSIEETNKLRAKLGLTPLEVNEKPSALEENGDIEKGAKTFVEDGMELVHKPAVNIAVKKCSEGIKDKLQAVKDKRKLHDKLLKRKGLADDDELDVGAAAWVSKSRRLEDERKCAEERAKILDEMDADFGVNSLLQSEIEINRKKAAQKRRAKQTSDLTGLIVGHDKANFLENQETILVLKDKDILCGEDDEVLVNPNLLDNEHSAKNVELRKKKDRYEPYNEEFDEFGAPKVKGLLWKYDEEIEGAEEKGFRLGEMGGVDLEGERQEAEVRRRLFMFDKKLETLHDTEYRIASEYYTQEEMLTFRKPRMKKDQKKMRKRKIKLLKADDLLPDTFAVEEDAEREAKVATHLRRRGEIPSKVKDKTKLEEGEVLEEEENKSKWQSADSGGVVDLQKLNKINVDDDESDSDDELVGGIDLSGVIVDDDAEEEMRAAIHARRLQNIEVKKEVENVASKVQRIKQEPMDYDEGTDSGLVIDSTMEYCRNLGNLSPLSERKDPMEQVLEHEELLQTDHIDEELQKWNSSHCEDSSQLNEKGRWLEATATTSAVVDAKEAKKRRENFEDDEITEPYSLLVEDRDLSRGVGAMLKLAAEKGYLDTCQERKVNGPSLKHLESKRFSQIEIGRYDIEEKYTKKLERMGTTGTGPVRPFPEKSEYKPDIRINYVDQQGREMESKDAFRILSWKFHGKGPGKRQIEKRLAKINKKELLNKMNSMDTPLGTLNKQLKKQESMQTPYIILSGSGRDTGAPLKKD